MLSKHLFFVFDENRSFIKYPNQSPYGLLILRSWHSSTTLHVILSVKFELQFYAHQGYQVNIRKMLHLREQQRNGHRQRQGF